MKMNGPITRPQLEKLPKEWLKVIAQFLSGFRNDTVDFRKPLLRSSVKDFYLLFVTVYVILGACGAAASMSLIRGVLKRNKADRRQESALHWLALNLGFNGALQSLFVLPATLAVLLVQNWVFGAALCFTLPMLQDAPLHVSMLSVVILAADRHRRVLHPLRPPLPGNACVIITWLVSVAVVLPHPAYTTYIDLGSILHDKFNGVGICVSNLEADMKAYTRLLFLIMYALPLGVAALLHVQTSRELKMLEDASVPRVCCSSMNEAESLQTDVDIAAERRAQHFLVILTASLSLCMLPVTILRIVRLVVVETYKNTGHFDIIYLLFVWIAYLPTCIVPLIFTLWERDASRVKEVERREHIRPLSYDVPYPRVRQSSPPCIRSHFTTV